MKKNKAIWITWENQIRNKSMSARLGADFFPITCRGSRLKRYLISGVKTLRLLRGAAGGYVFVQNPSIVLSFMATLLKPIYKYKLIVDAHNSGVFPIRKLQSVANFINRKANFVIVTNEGLASFIREIGGNPLVLPDPLPKIDVLETEQSSWNCISSPSVLAICSWANDEPYCEVIRAASIIPEVKFYITGNSKGRELQCHIKIPENVILTGFVSENDYHKLLLMADVILDLTTRENCLVCGAYEAVSVCKPVVLSDSRALRDYFGGVAVFVENEAVSIANGIKEIVDSYPDALAKAQLNSANIEMQWQTKFSEFYKAIFEK